MSGEIVTKDLGDGYFLHTYNIQTYYLTEQVVGNLSLPESITGDTRFLTAPQSLGQYEPYKLSQFVNSRDAIVQKGELVQLAHVENSKLIVNPYALQIFQHYEDKEISFVGNYGRLRSGKSFWYDKILNLSQFDGNNYTSNKGKQGIYFWSIPFTKGNLKFFLLDYVGFDGKDDLTKEDCKLLDLELLLAQKFVIVPEPEDQQLTILQPAHKHLIQSQKRFSDRGIPANKFSPYWPNEIYTLYRSAKPVRKQIDNIGSLFEIYNFSILHDALVQGSSATKEDLKKSTIRSPNAVAPLNQKYVRMTSIVFQDIYEKMKGKHHQGVTFNGKNIPKILQQAAATINNEKGVKIDQIFKGVRKDIAKDTLVRSKNAFLRELQFVKTDGPPLPIDSLIQGFEKGNNAAFNELDNADIDKSEREDAQKRLREEIDTLQLSILQANKRKTYLYYDRTLPSVYDDTKQANFENLKSTFSQSKTKTGLDHQASVPVAEKLKILLANNQQEEIILVGVTEKKHLDNLKKKIQHRQQELNRIKGGTIQLKGAKDGEQKDINQKHQVLTTRINDLKDTINVHKQAANTSVQEKQLSLAKLKEFHDRNQRLKSNFADNPTKKQEINALQELIKRTMARNKQHQEGLAVLDKTLVSSRAGAGRSLIRDVKTQNIKKVTLK